MHIELIATDGKIQKRILWVDVTSNGVYSGYCKKNKDIHISYHADGNVFHNWFGGKPKKIRALPPLNNFKGNHQLYFTSFDGDISRLHDTPLYRLKKLDAIINVDTRVYKKGVGCSVHLIEPNRHDLLGETTKAFPKTLVTETHAFFRCIPWISIVLFGYDTRA